MEQSKEIEFSVTAKQISIKATKEIIVQDLNLHIPGGQIMGLIGVSGCGKSTVLNAISGIRSHLQCEDLAIVLKTPDASIADSELPTSGRLMYVSSDDQFVPWLSAVDNVRVASRLNSCLPHISEGAVVELLDNFGISHQHAQKRPHELSLGMRRRLSLASAVAYRPTVLLIDEALNGLDRASATLVLDQIKAHSSASDGVVIFCSHELELVADLCDSICYLNRSDHRAELIQRADSQREVVQQISQLLLSTLKAERSLA